MEAAGIVADATRSVSMTMSSSQSQSFRKEWRVISDRYEEHFVSQIKEHITSTVKLQEQLHEREAAIMDLQRTLDDKDKELHAIRLDHEAAWAKEDLLREQNKELATFRGICICKRERDNSEAERAQHLQKIHELQEHVHI